VGKAVGKDISPMAERSKVGATLGFAVGQARGLLVGCAVGKASGRKLGFAVGRDAGCKLGSLLGWLLGCMEGAPLGCEEGSLVGACVEVGVLELGTLVGRAERVGAEVGAVEGFELGRYVEGAMVGGLGELLGSRVGAAVGGGVITTWLKDPSELLKWV